MLASLTFRPVTGTFHTQSGKQAGGVGKRGYRKLRVGALLAEEHRLAYYASFGVWPDGEVDHIDRDKANNRPENLRLTTKAQNAQNRDYAAGVSGFPGVRPRGSRFQARVTVLGRHNIVGTFDTADEAHAAYVAAKARLHPFSEEARRAA